MTPRRVPIEPASGAASREHNIRVQDAQILFTRRSGLFSAAGFFLSACSDSTSSFSQGIRTILTRKNELPVSRSRIASIPYASMAAKIGRGPVGIILLGQIDGSSLTWFAGRKGLFVTRNGRLVQTAGLPANLLRTVYLDTDPLGSVIKVNEQEKTGRFRRLVDMAPPDNYGIKIASTLRRLGTERIEIAELTFDTTVYEERCEADVLDWSYENRYWIGDGMVWQSRQHVHPTLPPVELQLLKPYVA